MGTFRLLFLFNALCIFNLQGTLYISEKPCTVLQGPHTQLYRPEGIAFSPLDNCLAVANSKNASITIYNKIGTSDSLYESTPSCIIQSDRDLNYVHGIAFDPSGESIGVAVRETNRILLYQRDPKKVGVFQQRPYNKLHQKGTGGLKPAGLSFDPEHGTLVVANRASNSSLQFYDLSNEKDRLYTLSTKHRLTRSYLSIISIGTPHDVDISPDGSLMAVVHKKFGSSSYEGSDSAITFYEKTNPDSPGFSLTPTSIIHLGKDNVHSISFHPSGNYIALTDELSVAKIYERIENTTEFIYVSTTPIHESINNGKAKAVAFSPDGESLAISYDNDLILLYSVYAD